MIRIQKYREELPWSPEPGVTIYLRRLTRKQLRELYEKHSRGTGETELLVGEPARERVVLDVEGFTREALSLGIVRWEGVSLDGETPVGADEEVEDPDTGKMTPARFCLPPHVLVQVEGVVTGRIPFREPHPGGV